MSLPVGAPRPDRAAYMTELAASSQGREYREHLTAALDLRPGQIALDVGCGPGTNLTDLITRVTGTGRVIGVDLEPAMAAQAQRRMTGHRGVGILRADGHKLPIRDGCVDRARVDRVLQHVASPAQVISELRRVTRPGSLVALGEPDWATLAVDADDLRTSADYARYICAEVVRNASVGRQLARLAAAAGFTVRSVQALTPLFTDFDQADRILGLTRVSIRAIAAGYLEEDRAARWLTSLRQARFLATATFFCVVAEVPA
jgi:ubiquinone/menaquinone biosynthesis C-methylase UbiE